MCFSLVVHRCPMSWLPFHLHFLNPHQAICLWVEAINQGSRGECHGTFTRVTNWAQSRVLKQIQTNNAGLCLRDTQSAPQTSSSRKNVSPEPQSQTKSSYSPRITVPLPKKTELELQIGWRRRSLRAASFSHDGALFWELQRNNSWKASRGPKSGRCLSDI